MMASAGKRKLEQFDKDNDIRENGQNSPPRSVSAAPEKGVIKRLYLENFVTYSNVEFFPSSHLNVIVGPNGTGKSTIVCGICLGLAGKPGMLGRANSVVDYIKHGEEKAVIEVELHNGDKAPIVIRREIVRSSSKTNAWSVNGASCSEKSVEKLVGELGIQVGNLCQFLPQDKVSDFAKMSQQELLQNTEKTINVQLHDDHVKLNSARDVQRDLEQQLSKMKERLEKEIGLNARLEDDVKNNAEREQELDKIKLYKSKRPWVLYEESRMKFEELKNEKKKVQAELNAGKALHEPLKIRCQEVQTNVQMMSQQISQQMSEIRKMATQISQTITSFEERDEKIQEIDHEFSLKQQEEVNRLKKLQDLERQLHLLKTEIANLDSDADIQPAIDRVSEEMRSVNAAMSQVINQGEVIRQEVRDIVEAQKGLKDELSRLQDVGRQRLNGLYQVHRDTYEAVLWLRENKSKFKQTIHEPMYLTIDVKNPQHAKYVECHIPFKDLRAFVCEDPEDFELFARLVRDEKRLRVNIVQAPDQPSESFQPEVPISQYGRFQFQSYLRELFVCPEPVMRYLCLLNQVHSIPIGNQFTKQHVDQVVRECPKLSVFYTADHQYSIRKSKYSGQSSTCCSEIRAAQKLTVTGDKEREENISCQLKMQQEQQRIKEHEYKQCQVHHKELETKMNQLRDEKKRLYDKKNEKRTLQQKIGLKEDSIKRLETSAVDLKEEEAVASQKKKKIEANKYQILVTLKNHSKKSVALRIERVKMCLRLVGLSRDAKTLLKELREKETSLSKLEEEYSRVSERFDGAKANARQLLQEAQEKSGISGRQELPEHLQTSFKLLPNTIEEIDTCIHQLQARIDCMMAVDKSVIQDYNSRKATIAALQKDSVALQKRLDNHKVEVETAKERWISPLQNLVSRINVKFSEFFQIMKCAGEVNLKVPENPEDYEKYGICIMVKFRDSEQLRELNAFHQSGGERSVSTVLYMMALQKLTKCPFRCVDEINQGMDPINERLVFELVVRTATRENTSQYFLLTPKLLPDLEYNDNMTIHFVHNGPFLLNHKEWSLKRFLSRRERL